MTQFLASVRDVSEAAIALAGGADIIDLKEPSRGALGAVEPATIAATLQHIAGRARVSATVGDLPMEAEMVRERVAAIAESGIDFVKLGLRPEGEPQDCLEALAAPELAARLILVLFADCLPDFDAVAAASRIGAAGIMFDTAGKDGGSLLDHMPPEALARFVAGAKDYGLTVGLAGSLRQSHVPALLALEPDLLGFRGALCHDSVRGGALDPTACRAVRALIPPAARTPNLRARMPLRAAPVPVL
jgi:uncharacterized protein (UPF0264 family)